MTMRRLRACSSRWPAMQVTGFDLVRSDGTRVTATRNP